MDRLTTPGFDFDRNFVASHIQSWSIAQALKRLQAIEDILGDEYELVSLKEFTKAREEHEMKMTEVNALCTRLKAGTHDEHDAREAAKVILELITEADEADRRLSLAADRIRELQERFDDLFQAAMGSDEPCEGYEAD